MQVGDEVTLTIERLAAGGDGVGRAPDGLVVFVPWTAPGDRLRARIVERRASFARGRMEALVSPGPDRVEPPCAVFGTCGGCAWQHVDYPAQLRAKAAILQDALERIGGLTLDAPVDVLPSPSPFSYRARARVLVADGLVGFRRRRSHEICATARCPVLVPVLEETLARLSGAPPADGELEIAAGDDGRVRVSRLRAGAGGRGGRTALRADDAFDLLLSPGVFAQANAWLRAELASAVLRAAGEGERAVELFAGAGFFTTRLARSFRRLLAVEASPTAARDLRANLRRAGAAHVKVLQAPAEDFLARHRPDAQPPDAVILDPPRTGLARGAAERLAALGAARIVYLSCDPATLARDLARLLAGGYALRRVEGFDLFPQTAHVEALAVLERRAEARAPGPAAR